MAMATTTRGTRVVIIRVMAIRVYTEDSARVRVITENFSFNWFYIYRIELFIFKDASPLLYSLNVGVYHFTSMDNLL